MSGVNAQDSWNEYSRLVISELERLNGGIRELTDEIQVLKQEIAQMKTREDNVTALRAWKASIDEVTSPTQLATSLTELKELKVFKTQAVTVWAVVQIIFGVLLGLAALF